MTRSRLAVPSLRTMMDEAVPAALTQLRAEFAHLPGTAELFDDADALVAGGKRARAQLVGLGWTFATDTPAVESPAVHDAGVAFELFQAAALVHDDVMDAADTRRGIPTTHRAAARRHAQQHRRGSSAQFGLSAAILLGDLLLAQCHRLFLRAATVAPGGPAALAEFAALTAELQLGQFLDVQAQTQPLGAPDGLNSIIEVVTYKSGRYSVEQPLVIGALLGGATASSVDSLRTVGRPLGIAFQLRDDVLGVFGNPSVTGKPAGGDLLEGKRTALLELTYQRATAIEREFLASVYSAATRTTAQVEELAALVESTGARAAHEQLIAEYVQQATTALEHLPAMPALREDLTALIAALTDRVA